MDCTVEVNTLRYDPALCVNCGRCIEVCPHAVFVLGEKAVSLENGDSCMECGACKMNCPTDAIDVESSVGCATAIMLDALRGGVDGPSCGCADDAGNKTTCC